jgi:hypothetical protein
MATVWIKQRGANPEEIDAMMNQGLDVGVSDRHARTGAIVDEASQNALA